MTGDHQLDAGLGQRVEHRPGAHRVDVVGVDEHLEHALTVSAVRPRAMLHLVGQARLRWDVPPVGQPLALAGRKDVALVLDEFVPTTLDAWRGRAVVLPGGVTGVPSDAPQLLPGDPEGALVARVVVVRHGGDVEGRTPRLGVRRSRLDHLLAADPPAEPLLAVVVEPGGATLTWMRGDPGRIAADLSRPDWRATAG